MRIFLCSILIPFVALATEGENEGQEPTETSKQPIRTLYLGHAIGYQPIMEQYFLIRSVPAIKDYVPWSPVVPGTYIQFDLESTPLQIKTNSTAGSGELIAVYTYTADLSYIGGVLVQFNSPIQYIISYCNTSWASLSVQPGDEADKIWTIWKTATALSIECNGVEVLNYQFSDSVGAKCASQWGGDVVEKIAFDSIYETASDSYRAKPTACPGFTEEGSVQGSWNDTDIGQTVTIECQKTYVRDGISERTCNSDVEWNIDAPLCRQLERTRNKNNCIMFHNAMFPRQLFSWPSNVKVWQTFPFIYESLKRRFCDRDTSRMQNCRILNPYAFLQKASGGENIN
uniref:Putative secretory peptide-50 n=1 Tax=Pleurobrachia bachei TaxID=34499 RepID=M4H1W4_PLEBA|nr:putative secretory peptide-50 [Pleurobrachia bachei]|eukprot:sb/3466383/